MKSSVRTLVAFLSFSLLQHFTKFFLEMYKPGMLDRLHLEGSELSIRAEESLFAGALDVVCLILALRVLALLDGGSR